MTRVSRIVLALASISGFAALTGCGIGTSAGPEMITSNTSVTGHIMGGHQPIVGSTVTMYAAGTGGYGAGQTTVSTGSPTTDANGMFAINYTCTSGQQLYLVASGGNAGAGSANAAAVLVAALGDCAGLTGPVNVDEVTTIAAAYALAPFADMSTGTSISIGTSTTNATGLAHAFLNANNLADYHYGLSRTTTPGGNGTVPGAQINTLANALAACVNSTGASSSGCSGVLVAPPAGTLTSTPGTTWQLALNWAKYPGNNVATVYSNPTAQTSFFTPTVGTGAAAPTDLSLGISYKAGFASDGVTNTYFPWDAKADASGNIWVSGLTGAGLVELASNGNVLSPNGGYGSTALQAAGTRSIAMDRASSPNVWVADPAGNVFSYNPSSSVTTQITLPTSVTVGSTATTVDQKAVGLGVDSANNVIYATYDGSATTSNMIGKIPANSSVALTSYATTPILNQTSSGAYFLSVDVNSNTAWAGSQSTAYVFNDVTPYTGGVTSLATRASAVNGTAFDSSDNAYSVIQSSGANGGSLCKFTPTAPVACTTANQIKVTTATNGLYGPRGIATDGSNRLFITSSTSTAALVEFDPAIYAAQPTGSNNGFLVNASGNGFNPTATSTTASGYIVASYDRNLTIDQAGAVWIATGNSAGQNPIVQVLGVAAPTNPVLAAGQYGVKP